MNIEALKEAHDLSLDGRDFAARQIILDVIANLKKEALAKPALMIYHDHICYKSQADDQSFGFWCPVTQDLPFPDLPFPEGTKFYTSPPKRKPLTNKQIIASNYPDGEENGPTIAAPDFELICFARQIEDAHGIKGD